MGKRTLRLLGVVDCRHHLGRNAGCCAGLLRLPCLVEFAQETLAETVVGLVDGTTCGRGSCSASGMGRVVRRARRGVVTVGGYLMVARVLGVIAEG